MQVSICKYDNSTYSYSKSTIDDQSIDSTGEHTVWYTPTTGYYDSPYIYACVGNLWGSSSSSIHTHSFYVAKALYSYIGYDGNDTIYLSTGSGEFYEIYNMENLSKTENTYTNPGIESNDSSIEAITSYGDVCDGSKLQINLNLTSVSEGDCYTDYMCDLTSALANEYMEVQTNAPSSIAPYVGNMFQTDDNNGFNIYSNSNNRGTQIDKDIASLVLDGVSLIPVAGYAATAISAAKASSNLVNTVSSPNPCAGTVDNKMAAIEYCFEADHVLYGAGTVDEITLPLTDLNHNFTITVTYYDNYIYCSSTNYAKTASTTQTLNAVTSSAIYGTVGLKPGCSDNNNTYNTSLNSTIYIKDVDNGDVYKVPIKNGHYLFFAKPNTKYELFYLRNGNFDKFKNNSDSTIEYIESASPGESISSGLYE